MTTLNAIEPTPEQIKKFLSDKKSGEPVYMLNLLKFKDKATYKNGENVSGREAYARYASAFSKLVKDKKIEGGGTWGGNMNSWLIGQGEGEWDAIGIFKYPSAEIMIETVSSDEYRKIHKHRRAGLEGQLLISCDNKGVF
tara:strand:- start:3193 stop:3612 length:420 start_codon:yes stop_codon:yes gene_type:complete